MTPDMLRYLEIKKFASAEDAEDPFMQLDIKNAFGSLCARMVLDVCKRNL